MPIVEEKYKEKSWLAKKIEGGHTQREIGKLCDVSHTTIGYWMRKYNLTPKGRGMIQEDFEERIKRLTDGKYSVLGEYQGVHQKVCIKHNVCNFKWEIRPNLFFRGRRCPLCNGNFHDKDTAFFKLEVEGQEGDEYQVLGIYIDAHTKILMKHRKCGQEWEVTPAGFLEGRRCPHCAGNQKKTTENFQREVEELIDGKYKVLSEYTNAKSKVKLRHQDCGYEWKETPSHFLGRARCPKCHSQIRNKDTDFFKQEVQELVGGRYTVLGIYQSEKTKILMRHEKCGYKWRICPNNFLQGKRCPRCNQSHGERAIASLLDKSGFSYKREFKFQGCKTIRSLLFDFYVMKPCKMLIEFDGIQHYKPISYFGGRIRWKERVRRDHLKDKFASRNNIPLLRISYLDREKDMIETKIKTFLTETLYNKNVTYFGGQ